MAQRLIELASSTRASFVATDFFSARRGDETVCLLREDGSFPLRSHVLHEGIRFPLGVASAGLAILAHLPEREQEAYLSRADLTSAWGALHSPDSIRSRLAETRRLGYATNPGLIVEGSWGMAAAVFDGAGAPAWALSLTGVESRFREERRPELGRILLDQAHRLTRSLQSSGTQRSLRGMPRGMRARSRLRAGRAGRIGGVDLDATQSGGI